MNFFELVRMINFHENDLIISPIGNIYKYITGMWTSIDSKGYYPVPDYASSDGWKIYIKVPEYNLSFEEAIIEIKNDKTVEFKIFEDIYQLKFCRTLYKNQDIITTKLNNGTWKAIHINREMTEAKYRIVE